MPWAVRAAGADLIAHFEGLGGSDPLLGRLDDLGWPSAGGPTLTRGHAVAGGSARRAEDWLNDRRRSDRDPAGSKGGGEFSDGCERFEFGDWLTCLDSDYPPRWRGHPSVPAVMRRIDSERPNLPSLPDCACPWLRVEGPSVALPGKSGEPPVWITMTSEALSELDVAVVSRLPAGRQPESLRPNIHRTSRPNEGASGFSGDAVIRRVVDALRSEAGDRPGILFLAPSLHPSVRNESPGGHADAVATMSREWRELGGTVCQWVAGPGEGLADRWRRERAVLLAADLIVGPSRPTANGAAPSSWQWARRSITDPSVEWRVLGPAGQLCVIRRPGEIRTDDLPTVDRHAKSPPSEFGTPGTQIGEVRPGRRDNR